MCLVFSFLFNIYIVLHGVYVSSSTGKDENAMNCGVALVVSSLDDFIFPI